MNTTSPHTISVICVFNDKNTFDRQLYASLKLQDVEYELIALDNTTQQFRSAAEALNYGSQKATGEILVYSHQDIFLKRSEELRRFAEAIANQPTGCILGAQGVKEPSKVYYSNITYGAEYIPEIVGDYPDDFYAVSSVDEGFFGMKKKTWEMLKFDEALCDNWHLYCVELCLRTRKHGNAVYVFPTQLHHFSMGTISLGYMKNLKKLCSVYRKDFKYIWTTCYKVRTNRLYIHGLYALWCLNRKLRGRLR